MDTPPPECSATVSQSGNNENLLNKAHTILQILMQIHVLLSWWWWCCEHSSGSLRLQTVYSLQPFTANSLSNMLRFFLVSSLMSSPLPLLLSAADATVPLQPQGPGCQLFHLQGAAGRGRKRSEGGRGHHRTYLSGHRRRAAQVCLLPQW